MIRNFFRQSQPWTKNASPTLGRWKRQDNIVKKIDFANYDNCGDTVCGNYAKQLSKSSEKPIKDFKNIKKEDIDLLNLFEDKWNNIISDFEFKHKLKRKTLKNSKQDMIDDYNTRWKTNLTIELYDKYFK